MLLMMTGCQTNEPSKKVSMPLSICLPASEVQAAQHAPRRIMGDPGTTERYLFPHHLYYIVMKKTGESTWVLWHQEHKTLTDEDWVATHNTGLLPTLGDSVYQYKEEIDLLLSSGDKFVGHVYAIASAEELTFTIAGVSAELGDIDNMNDLLNLQFSTSTATIQNNLQHIYTTPYNFEIDDEYYGSFNSTYQKVPYVNLMLYHVAAKVDITWHVAEEKRTDPATLVRLTQMDALELFNGNAYCFRPMRNELAEKQADGYDRENIVTASDAGLWWEGRTYFYTIPYIVTGTTVDGKNYFPLQMKMETNGSGEYYTPTLNLKIDTSAVFVPWLRANFNINAALSAGSPTLTVDE